MYELQNTFTSETRVLRRLQSLHLAPDTISRLLRVRSVLSSGSSPIVLIAPVAHHRHTESSDKFRVDTRGAAVSFFNNVEKDAMYRSWSRDFSSMLSPGWPNEVRLIRRNIYVVVAVVDAASLTGLGLVSRLVSPSITMDGRI